jgi:phosphoribosylaminoimidazole-succinocarboxamide synthase
MCWRTGIPGKGKILTQISLFWFDLLSDAVLPNHLITAEVEQSFPASLQPYAINWKAARCW